MIEIWIRSSKARLRLPVLPEKITLEDGAQHERVTLQEIGEVVLPGKRTLCSMQFGSYFPLRYDRNCNYAAIPDPAQAAALCQEWARNAEVLRLVITGSSVDVNMEVLMEAFSATSAKLIGDVEYTMTLVEHRPLKAKRVKASVMALRPRPTAKPKAKPKRPRKPKLDDKKDKYGNGGR